MHPIAVLAATPTPSPSVEFDENLVTPGVQGFFAIFLLAAAVVLLAVSMVRRIRRVRYREEVRLRLEAEGAEGGIDASDSAASDTAAAPDDTAGRGRD